MTYEYKICLGCHGYDADCRAEGMLANNFDPSRSRAKRSETAGWREIQYCIIIDFAAESANKPDGTQGLRGSSALIYNCESL